MLRLIDFMRWGRGGFWERERERERKRKRFGLRRCSG